MKKICAFFIALMMALSLAACGGGNDAPAPSGSGTSRQEQQPGSTSDETAKKPEDKGTETIQLHNVPELAEYPISEFLQMGIGTLDEINDTEFNNGDADNQLLVMFNDVTGDGYTAYLEHLIDNGGKEDETLSTAMENAGKSNIAYYEWGLVGAYHSSLEKTMKLIIKVYIDENGSDVSSGAVEETSEPSTEMTAGTYEGPFDDKWPDCVWTRLVPKPEFSEKSNEESYSAEALVNGFAAAYTGVTMDEAKEYVKAVQAAGFDQSITENGNDTLYYYMAFNEDHVKFELNLNPVLGTTILMQ